MPAFLGGPEWPEFDAALARFDFVSAARLAAADTALDPAERWFVSGVCLSFTGEPIAAEKSLHESYRLFSYASSPRAAAAAAFLGRLHFFAHDNVHVANGWFARARTAAHNGGGSVERALATFPLPACFLPDAAHLEAAAESALADLRGSRNPDLEAKLLADLGTARVALGQVDAGMTGIDEAMTMLVSREASSPLAAIEVVCNLATSCQRAGDLERAGQWLDQAERHLGLGHWDGPAFLYAHCQASLGTLLADLGRWDAAEAALRLASEKAASASPHSINRVGRAVEDLHRRAPRRPDPLAALSPREREILTLLPTGHTNAEIAARLHNSVRTIDHHVSSILTKLNLRSRTEAAVLATMAGTAGVGTLT